ncbi:helix-turn-helix transcriptional regulator [Paenalcaligenes faecalis]|uniref:helix-turn-helix transcriptional regulator n=1 Tax=Paenalcaligenes faecalis TaxID=2980099 RepID=UPI0022B9852F|nr:AlpA family phage regulatory protein [Paenalcaligenes faecalis]
MSKQGFQRLPETAKEVGIAHSTIWLWVRQGRFPAPVKLGPRVTAWRKSDVSQWLADPQAWQEQNGVAQ